MTGLAPDGGLLIPSHIPDVSDTLATWADLTYADLAFEIIRLFSDVPDAELKTIVEKSYSAFRHPEVAPTIPVGELYILELFHGPTLAFKDIALQFLGNMFSYILARQDRDLNILAATSGDTGSAAIQGVRGRDRIRIFVMHPDGRVSPLQEKQMTSVLDDNVFNLAVNGTFDDCQTIMKSIFSDVDFKTHHELGAVNSVNWARVLAQIVYYFYAAFQVMKQTGSDRIQFSVPTGNFGDILAGYYAKRMGLPIERLVLATNENDILYRFFQTGVYSTGEVVPTLSPSMDIQVASNFERYLFYKAGCDGKRVESMMEAFKTTGQLSVPVVDGDAVDDVITAGRGHTEATLAVIRRYFEQHHYILDPHTAVGVHAAEPFAGKVPMICLATAHPAKFNKAIEQAIGRAAHHEILDALEGKPTRQEMIAADELAVRSYLQVHIA